MNSKSLTILFWAVISLCMDTSCVKRYGKYEMYNQLSIGQLELSGLSLDLDEPLHAEFVIQYLLQEKRKHWDGVSPRVARKLTEQLGTEPYICFLLAEYYFDQREYDLALQQLNTPVEGMPELEVYDLKSKIYNRLGAYDLAIDQINNAILINSSNSTLFDQKANIYLHMKDSLSALTYYKQAWSLDQSKLDIPVKVARLYAEQGELEEAISWLDRVDIDQSSPEVRAVKIKIYRSQGMDLEANAILKGQLDKGDLSSGKELVNFFKARHKADSVLHYASVILEQDSVNRDAMMDKAEMYDLKGYFSSSIQYYEQVLEIDSLDQEAIEGVRKVNGKIAYLRKIRERKESIPTFDIASPELKKTLD
ncbi:tetratricopeptide repeat protein [Reichenbachiella agariperforans]|uniref:tetratricopeptide repeat protein n=1 Tax=Reichenbachiella agariperforans TaxID=156994 RepID=UPI001C099C8B|nr:tetratricopeptide repeat protein [Reichenbachiella agariperforans]MBU2913141.1 tetratricopeptide repeat protein [Reichenbachiella agariperforans]